MVIILGMCTRNHPKDHTRSQNIGYPNPIYRRAQFEVTSSSANFVGNPVSYSERVFEERSKYGKQREEKRVQVPLDIGSVPKSFHLSNLGRCTERCGGSEKHKDR